MIRKIIIITNLISVIILFSYCKKETKPIQYSIEDFMPEMEFVIEPGYIFQDTSLSSKSIFKVGIIASKNSLSGASIESFQVKKSINGADEIVYEETEMSESSIYWTHTDSVSVIPGDEIWRFLIKDSHWHLNTLSFKISSDGSTEYYPSIEIDEGQCNVSGDTILKTNAWFWWEVSLEKSLAEETPLSYFKVVKIFNDIETFVYEYHLPGGSASYGFGGSANANAEAGEEKWIFTVRDIADRSDTVSFIITSEAAEYTPAFLTTYEIINPHGNSKLDFSFECSTDDWEMISCLVRYPTTIKCEKYYGSGEVFPIGSSGTLPNHFMFYEGNWNFAVNGIIHSGQYAGMEFTAFTSVMVP